LYFDCQNGISGDMACAALFGLLSEKERSAATAELEKFDYHEDHDGHSHNSYNDIKRMIGRSAIGGMAKHKALSIYSVIAKAEASVHGTTVEDVHFHEVGRKDAVMNIVKTAICVDIIEPDEILCSEICDGKGFIECSHGTIPVPVPAVMAMRKESGLVFITDESVGTEMVTPSGLAVLIGLGARFCKEIPEGAVLSKCEARGRRNTGRDGGLTVYLLEV